MKKFFVFTTLILLSVNYCFAKPNFKAYKQYLKGIKAFKSGKIDKGINYYEKVIALDETALSVYKELAYVYMQKSNKEKAFQIAQKLYDLDKSSQTTAFLGKFYSDAAEKEKSIKFWQETLKMDPENETAMLYMAVFSADKDLKQAAQYWKDYLKQQPESSIGYLQLGLIQEKLGKTKDALNCFEKAISIQKDMTDAYISKARVYESLKDFKNAQKEYEKYITFINDNPYIYHFLGKAYYQTNDFEKAIASFKKSKDLSSLDLKRANCFWLAVVYEKLFQIDDSIKEYEELLKSWKDVAVYGKLAYYYSVKRDFVNAEKNMQKALSYDAENYEALYLMGLIYYDWQKYDKCIEYLTKTIVQKPDLVDAYFYLGYSYWKKGDLTNAEKVFKQVIDINPKYSRGLNELGYFYVENGIHYDLAKVYIQRAINSEPNNGTYLDSLGLLYYKQGNYNLALKQLLKSLETVRNPWVFEHLGDTFVGLKQGTQAWVSYTSSYDMKSSQELRNKIDDIEKIMPFETFANQMLIRTQSNFKRILPFKSGFIAKIKSGVLSSKSYIQTTFKRDVGLQIEIPKKYITTGGTVLINNGTLQYEPKALKDLLQQDYNEILNFLSEITKDNFLIQFINDSSNKKTLVVRENDKIIYKKNDYTIILNSKTALVEKISKKDMTIEILEYEAGMRMGTISNYSVFRIPKKIKVLSQSLNIDAIFQASDFYSIDNGFYIDK